MEYRNCCLYLVKSKKVLKSLLYIDRDVYCKTSFINSKINVYLNSDGRLIEAPEDDIKAIQRNILHCLEKIELPEYVFFGVKNRSYDQLTKIHEAQKFTLHIDLSKFFYNIRREKVYRFYSDKLKTSPDVAKILTDYSTIDLALKNYCGNGRISDLIKEKIICPNHLIAGAPHSPILSFLVNEDFFSALYDYAQDQGLIFSVYADDLIFSDNREFSESILTDILKIIDTHHFRVAKDKLMLKGKHSI